MQAFEHQLRISSDDSRTVAAVTISELLEIRQEVDDEEALREETQEVEAEFFEHCLSCDDRLAFSIVWWELAKNNWCFHEGWTNCRKQFEAKIFKVKVDIFKKH